MADEDFHKQRTLAGMGAPVNSSPTPIPLKIGPYKIEALFARGGMSTLYLGLHPETQEPITIKVLQPRFLSHPEVVQRFLREAEIIALSDHPNIVKLYGHGNWEGGLYIAMEFIQGISLRQALLHTPLSLKKALEIVIDIAYALCHLHTHGVIHRDLKPENILINEAGQVKVIDFGISQLLTERTESEIIAKQHLMGTPIYMSPEQRENPENVSYPSDIYSLGIITYELVLGKLSHGYIHLSLMPKGLQKILHHALQPVAGNRYQDVVDFITEVSAYLNSDTLAKENPVGNQLSSILENLRHAQEILAPSAVPTWPHIDIGLSSPKGLDIYGIYYDFIALADGSFGILMAESSAKGAEGVIYTALLRGMIKAIKQQANQPIELATKLNRLLVQDKGDQAFAFSYLQLLPKQNRLCYLSCGYGNLWHLSNKTKQLTKFEANNMALGIDAEMEFKTISLEWNGEDHLILSSLLFEFLEEFDAASFFQRWQTSTHRSAQKIIDAILLKVRLAQGKRLYRPPTLIGIKRVLAH